MTLVTDDALAEGWSRTVEPRATERNQSRLNAFGGIMLGMALGFAAWIAIGVGLWVALG
jgi:hypothetical protein